MYFQNLYEQIRGGGGKNVVDDNTNHRGARMVFLIMNSLAPLPNWLSTCCPVMDGKDILLILGYNHIFLSIVLFNLSCDL